MTGRHLRACGDATASPQEPGDRPAGAFAPGDGRGSGAVIGAGVIPAEVIADYRAGWSRIAVALRAAITCGAIPPGTAIDPLRTAREHGAPQHAAAKALRALAEERLVVKHGHRWHATPAGPPSPAASARMGRLLVAMRAAAQRNTSQLAAASLTPPEARYPRDVAERAAQIEDAESGAWQPRDLWEALDAALGSDGSLLRVHDACYTPPPGQRQQPAGGRPGNSGALARPPGYAGLLDLVTGVVREEITTGAIPPGAFLDCRDIARRHGLAGTGHLVGSALARLRAEGIVYCHRNHRYAAPAGPPGPAAGAGLGAELRRRREEARLTPGELAGAPRVLPRAWGTFCAHRAEEIRAAEAGTWYERGFWAELDATLQAGGDLLRLHDRLYHPAVKPAVPGTPAPQARSASAATTRVIGSQPPGSDRADIRARTPGPAAVAR